MLPKGIDKHLAFYQRNFLTLRPAETETMTEQKAPLDSEAGANDKNSEKTIATTQKPPNPLDQNNYCGLDGKTSTNTNTGTTIARIPATADFSSEATATQTKTSREEHPVNHMTEHIAQEIRRCNKCHLEVSTNISKQQVHSK